MNKIFRILIPILILVCYTTLIGQSNYPYFSDAKKQLIFEKYRVYIIEEKGTNTITLGGGSKTVLANPIQSLFGKQAPQYVAEQEPSRTLNVNYHNFKMEQNGNEISEIELLSLLDLKEERDKIIASNKKITDDYEHEVDLIKKAPITYHEKTTSLAKENEMILLISILSGSFSLGTTALWVDKQTIGTVFFEILGIGALALTVAIYSPFKQKVENRKIYPKSQN